VLAGSVLGFFVHPYWIGLAAFVGAGLAFAGITDTCGMGMLLARMPWNQVDNSNAGGVSDAESAVSLKTSSASERVPSIVPQRQAHAARSEP
jgi:hypothetical protein